MINGELVVIKYSVTDAAIGELKAKYAGLKIVDSASYENVRVAIGEVRDLRVGVENHRKHLKATALEYGRNVDAEAKRITALLEDVENPLKAEKQKVDDEKARIKAEKEKKEFDRVAEIRARIFDMQKLVSNFLGKTAPELQKISEALFDIDITKEVYQEFTDEAERVKMECLDIALKAREVRIKWEVEEAARKAEAERLEKQRQAQEAERKRLDDEKAKLEADKKAEQARKEKEEIEAQARERTIKELELMRESEEKEKKERQESEAKERERKAAQAPDKEKLLNFADALSNVFVPAVLTKEANIILDDALRAHRGVIGMIRREADKL